MRKLNVDALEVTSFETTAQRDEANAISGSVCDSPWCAQSIDRPCFPEA